MRFLVDAQLPPALALLSDVYALLTYYLRHCKAVDEYVSTHPEWFTVASETR